MVEVSQMVSSCVAPSSPAHLRLQASVKVDMVGALAPGNNNNDTGPASAPLTGAPLGPRGTSQRGPESSVYLLRWAVGRAYLLSTDYWRSQSVRSLISGTGQEWV